MRDRLILKGLSSCKPVIDWRAECSDVGVLESPHRSPFPILTKFAPGSIPSQSRTVFAQSQPIGALWIINRSFLLSF
jgi:hypothetical protein